MSKSLLLILLLLTCSFSFSQGLYFEGGVGYNVGINRMTPGVYNSTSTHRIGVSKSTSEQVYYSLGEGVSFSGAVGVLVSKNIGFELSISHVVGGELLVESYNSFYSEYSQTTTVNSYEYIFKSRLTQVVPSIVFTFGEGAFVPFSKLGLIYNTGSLTLAVEEVDDTDVLIREVDFTGGVSFGVSAVFGVEYVLSEKIKLTGALNFKLLSYSPKRSEVVKNELNGESILETMSVINREKEYYDKIEYDSSTYNSNEPGKELTQLMSASSLGFQFGFKVML